MESKNSSTNYQKCYFELLVEVMFTNVGRYLQESGSKHSLYEVKVKLNMA